MCWRLQIPKYVPKCFDASTHYLPPQLPPKLFFFAREPSFMSLSHKFHHLLILWTSGSFAKTDFPFHLRFFLARIENSKIKAVIEAVKTISVDIEKATLAKGFREWMGSLRRCIEAGEEEVDQTISFL
jgi:hypothetical protein